MTEENFKKEKRRIEEMERKIIEMFGPPDTTLLNDLIDGNYRNAFQLGYGDGQYVQVDANANSLSIGATPTTFVNVWGNWGPFWAYWVFVAPEDVNYSKHPQGECLTSNPPNLQLWDYDGRAAYPPQDRELFHFQMADPELGTVTMRNYQDYIAFDGNHFYVSGQGNAAHFSVVFCPRMELEIPPPAGMNQQQHMARFKNMKLLTAPHKPVRATKKG